jgi:hypothetical protein
MMEKIIVTLRDAPAASVDVPDETGGKKLQRSCFGAIRLFPGIPKTVSRDELEYLKVADPGLFARVHVQPYVESKRVDRRGAAEAEVSHLADQEGLTHLSHSKQVELLQKRGKIGRSTPKKASSAETSAKGERRKPGGK